MEVQVRDLGSHKGCYGWTTSETVALPVGVPDGKWVKVLNRSNLGGWGWHTTLDVVSRQGDRWTIREECFEPVSEYSLDEGATWLPEKHWQVREALMTLFCKEEADLEESVRRVKLTGNLLKKN